jgi:phosphohistidine swiveling domain-containing protein
MNRETVLKIVQACHWNIQGFNGLPLYLTCAATESGWMVEDVIGEGYSHFFYLFSNKRAMMYYDEQDWQNIGTAYYNRVTTTDGLLELEKKHQEKYQEIEQQRPEINLQSASVEELCSTARILGRQIAMAVGYAHAIEGIIFVSERRLREILEQKGVFTERLLSELCTPVYSSFLADARALLWKIKQNPEDTALTDQFLAGFSWIDSTYIGTPSLNKAEILKRAEAITEAPESFNTGELLATKKVLLDPLGFTAEEQFIIDTIQFCFRWQDDRKRYILQSIAILDPVMERLGENVDVDPLALKFSLPEELAPEKLADPAFKDELIYRAKGSAYYTTPEGTDIFSGEDFQFFTDALHVSLTEKMQEIRGMSASKGKVSGVVRVCESVSDIDSIQRGEILVASMTRPEYLPAMQKAAGFITNEGGVTCHAAIIAREMDKPCVIGTRIATQVLRSGDRVELDADQGIVRILA